MTTYNVTIITPLGWLKRIETTSRKELANLRKEALEYANSISFSDLPKDANHIVYYYEKGNNVEIRMTPTIVDDNKFYSFVDDYKPTFVGARHRR